MRADIVSRKRSKLDNLLYACLLTIVTILAVVIVIYLLAVLYLHPSLLLLLLPISVFYFLIEKGYIEP